MAPRVLISDELSTAAVQIFKDRGVEVDYQPKLGKDKDALLAIIGNYDGLAIRSATKATEKLIEGIFEGETINTPSMLCVEDWIVALEWGKSVVGLPALIARADANARAVWDFCEGRDWIANLAEDPATRSNTSVCVKFTDPRIVDGAAFAKAVAKRLEGAGAALDVGAYRDAPPGLRIWCGATVELADVQAMLPWLDWAFHEEIAKVAQAA